MLRLSLSSAITIQSSQSMHRLAQHSFASFANRSSSSSCSSTSTQRQFHILSSSSSTSSKSSMQHRQKRLKFRPSHSTLKQQCRQFSASADNSGATSSSSSSSSVVDSSYLSGSNAAFVDQMFLSWHENPSSVHRSWDVYFRTGQYKAPPELMEEYTALTREPNNNASSSQLSRSSNSSSTSSSSASMIPVDSAAVVQLVRAFQVRGHLLADLDPLGLMAPRPDHEDLDISTYGFKDADLDRIVDLSGLTEKLKGFLDKGRQRVTLRQIYTRLKETYCGTIGYEYMHIPSIDKCNWIREKIETREALVFTREAKLQVLDRLTWADHFEQFLKTKFNTAKRFGLEGAESFIAGMKSLIGRSAELGVENVVIGMPHRGRLNVLNTVVRKNLAQIFAEFEDAQEDHDPDAGNGDVKYHLGMSFDRKSGKSDKLIHLSLLANPSHLEAVDPVVVGKTKAKQFYAGNDEAAKHKSIGLLLHGDAAFAGQGVVYETFGLAELPNYTTGGTIHIVVNNQVGFTTSPDQSRSSPYCTDLAKAFNAPIFHVNGDDPEAVVHVCELAAEWRHKYGTDVVIDLICYRKNGHNEIDEPMFTQPLMYKKIKNLPTALEKYQKRLLSEGIKQEEIKKISDSAMAHLEKAYSERSALAHAHKDWLASNWKGLKSAKDYSAPQPTGVSLDTLRHIGEKVSSAPSSFHLHSRLAGVLKAKMTSIKSGKGIDWGTAEALAFGSLLLEKKHVRLSGQDVERGTFSHRHAVFHDQENDHKYTPLNDLSSDQAKFTVTNSHLSEYGVLGFELGYSLESPHALILWEAQFGDFFNTAQVIVDQFISSGEDKWLRQTGLVMLLPHGYEGAGPEHSSCRLERFLQQTNDHPDHIPVRDMSKQIQQSNWQIVNCTTPANYFHVLRRQLHREFRKPLIVCAPKSLLRAAFAKSDLSELGPNTSFKQVISDPLTLKSKDVKRIIFCSGKVFYDLERERAEKKYTNVALIRIEQLSPFPFHLVADEASKYNKSAEIVWVQEEPMNMGGYTYVKDRISTAATKLLNRHLTPRYIGRAPSASTAAGHASQHNKELQILLAEAFAGL